MKELIGSLSSLSLDELLRYAGILSLLALAAWGVSELIFIGSQLIGHLKVKKH